MYKQVRRKAKANEAALRRLKRLKLQTKRLKQNY